MREIDGERPDWTDPCSEEARLAENARNEAYHRTMANDVLESLAAASDGADGVDPDDKARVDAIAEMIRLADELPAGWTKRKSPAPGQAVYVHDDGRESWKNPSFDKIQQSSRKFQAERTARLQQETAAAARSRHGKPSAVRKLRKMLAAGLPEAAVAQRAAIEGVDMALVLAQTPTSEDEGERGRDGQPVGDDATETPASTKRLRDASFADADDQSDDLDCSVNPRLAKKYRNMIRTGVSIAAVQQAAFLESSLEPHRLLQICGIRQDQQNDNVNGQPQYAVPSPSNAKIQKDPLLKYKNMIKSGVPVGAVQQTALRDGVDAEAIVQALGTATHRNDSSSSSSAAASAAAASAAAASAAVDSLLPVPIYFTPIEDEFVDVPKESDLAKVVVRMVRTVQRAAGKRGPSGRSSADNDPSMANPSVRVDMQSMYNALGALQGVQWAIDKYNSTTTQQCSWPEAKVKRQAYSEMAVTLGIPLPPSFKETVCIPGLTELIAHIKNIYKNQLDDIRCNCKDNGLHDFDSLAFLYTPGSRVIAKNAGGGGVDMICQVVWNRYEQGRTIMGKESKYFQACFQFIVAVSSEHFAIAEVVEGVQSFEGTRSMSALNFIPLSTYSESKQQSIISRYRRRGQVYGCVATGQPSYMEYGKNSFFIKRGGGSSGGRHGQFHSYGSSAASAMATGGRVMIDTQGAYDHGHSISTGSDIMVTAIKLKYKEYKLHLRSVKSPQVKQNVSTADKRSGDIGMAILDDIPDDFLDLTWPAVVGFSFASKAWGDVLVDSLTDIHFQDDIFDRLVLPPDRKRIVKALIRNGNTSFHDVIQGKGEGSVFLLYGPPGVGKTLTAEAVCEVLHKPLYSVSLGQLGTTPSDLEIRLVEILSLCGRWDALILLDEADIFLERRTSSSSLERNAMVSVMLRLVEYFQGILFLTSNRVDSLDPAFQTRITLALRFDNLDRAGRAQVWENLLQKSGYMSGAISNKNNSGTGNDFDVHVLSEAQLNGREIKNCIRMSLAMAAEDDMPLTQSLLLETVATVCKLNEQLMASKSYDWEDPVIKRAAKQQRTKKSFFKRHFGLGNSKQ